MPDRIALKIQGMDCAEEVAILKREVGPQVGGEEFLSFDILNGVMTVLPSLAVLMQPLSLAGGRTVSCLLFSVLAFLVDRTLVGEERFELSISRVRAERFKPRLATPLHGDDGEIRTRALLIEGQAASRVEFNTRLPVESTKRRFYL